MEDDVRHLNTVDISRVAHDIRTDLRSHDLISTYVDINWKEYQNTAFTKQLLRPINIQSRDAFHANLESAVKDSAANPSTDAFRAMPQLYVSRPFKKGVALGTHANYKLLGKNIDTLLAPHITNLMPRPTNDHPLFINQVIAAALKAYDYDNFGPSKYDGGLLELTDDIAEVAYDDELDIYYCKLGAALAQQAYRAYQIANNEQFIRIISRY